MQRSAATISASLKKVPPFPPVAVKLLSLLSNTAVDTNDPAAKSSAVAAMVALLNRRSYIRNLVRDVNTALE